MAGFANINVSQGSVATYARYGGMFNIHLTANLIRNLLVKKIVNRLRSDRIIVMCLWPRRAYAVCIFTARCYASAVLAMALYLSVRPSQVGVLRKRLNVGSHKQHHTTAQGL